MKRGIIMDELNMDSLDLPEMEHDYSDVPDASEGLDEPARTSPAFGAGEDLSDIEMPVLSEMDGSAPVQPVKAEPQKQAPLQASVQTSAQISEMGGVSPMGGISEMGASANNSPAANSMTGTASVSGISEMGASSYSAPKEMFSLRLPYRADILLFRAALQAQALRTTAQQATAVFTTGTIRARLREQTTFLPQPSR